MPALQELRSSNYQRVNTSADKTTRVGMSGLKRNPFGYRYSVVVPFDPGRLLFGGAAGLEAVARCLDLEVRRMLRSRLMN